MLIPVTYTILEFLNSGDFNAQQKRSVPTSQQVLQIEIIADLKKKHAGTLWH